ncbi:hypothetical protein PYCCODRAFT_1438179 [Trametes coccinea BRFM310]|uniref:4Fe-4S ferredoxin-type domain-containing protein n=1 Tax=Trametes coccinea (strain BRFM310) TaxID=1353009 RepID=A0A1Y2IEL2_TRAC3|nr:hypothetical protein PYCCODRAFT_1438179 [Trametes coccinea BRFM310]
MLPLLSVRLLRWSGYVLCHLMSSCASSDSIPLVACLECIGCGLCAEGIENA